MKKKLKPIVFAILLLSFGAQAYEFSSGKFFVRGVVGPSINVVRFNSITRGTPGAGMVLGVEGEYVIDKPWSMVAGLRPSLSPGFVDIGFGAGVKYRWSDLGVPLIVSTSIEITPAVLIPTATGVAHYNLGLRPSVGLDYFLMHNLVLGLQLAIEPSYILNPSMNSFEASVEFLFGMMYKI